MARPGPDLALHCLCWLSVDQAGRPVTTGDTILLDYGYFRPCTVCAAWWSADQAGRPVTTGDTILLDYDSTRP
ncbi:hypothetical protein RRG08_034136 [Elysia crispata]|uniref:Uncharacterized protein n=1 Tax=Elysia crispata TaxID=231223 RepID=A0AAE1DIK6_9GAST|nr:hypothetical protein RRG08_034136 [Elysia crispata]